MQRIPLDSWTARRIGADPGQPVLRKDLERWQLESLRHLVRRVRAESGFYARRIPSGFEEGVSSLADLASLPLTTQADLREHGEEMVCVSQDETARIVTLPSSGTTGLPKRLHFTRQDLELTADFFRHGMRGLVAPGMRVLVLLPGETPDSTGDLLRRALLRDGVEAHVHGMLQAPEAALRAARELGADCLVGLPVQLLTMARFDSAQTDHPPLTLESVLLCSDYAPQSLSAALETIWNCRVFEHYGAVETGLGGAVECDARAGLHLREADLIVEIIEPEAASRSSSDHGPMAGGSLPEGRWGEVVVTTLHRQALPLIRYRTGDIGRLLPGVCSCGSGLKRLDKVRGRRSNTMRLGSGQPLSLALLDEVLFGLDDVLDFTATLEETAVGEELRIEALTLPAAPNPDKARLKIHAALAGLRELEDVALSVRTTPWTAEAASPAKRQLTDRRKRDESL